MTFEETLKAMLEHRLKNWRQMFGQVALYYSVDDTSAILFAGNGKMIMVSVIGNEQKDEIAVIENTTETPDWSTSITGGWKTTLENAQTILAMTQPASDTPTD